MKSIFIHPSDRARLQSRGPYALQTREGQKGVTLIELMVGIAIGLLTITVGLGALMVSRGVSGTVNEASSLQQQAAHAFRIMGQQIRQAGSMELNLNPDLAAMGASGATPALVPVAFDPPDPAGIRPPFSRVDNTIQGLDSPTNAEYALSIGYQNMTETVNATPPATGTEDNTQLKDCLAENTGVAKMPILMSRFTLRDSSDVVRNGRELVCANTLGIPQPIIQNVAAMTVQYAIQDNSTGTARLQYASAATAAASTNPRRGWGDVYAVEVCLELMGTENIDTAGASYTRCDGTTALRGNRLRMVFRNTFQIRSQGQPPV